ncbi:MAG TPA: TonB-dependent receptor, partial [Bryobacteraceae bacterium]
NWGSVLDDVYTFNPTTIMNVRLAWNRFVEGNDKPSAGFDPTTLGLPGYVAANSPRLVLPRFDFDSIDDIGTDAGSRTPFDIFQIFGDVVKLAGNHSLKMGADVREYRESNISYGDAAGHFTFRNNWTTGPLDNTPGAPLGDDIAAFLLGLPTGGDFQLNAFRTNQSKYLALFIQDDWHVRSNLTLNLGLRYERDFGTEERFNRTLIGFDTTTASPIAAAAMAAYAKNPVPQLPVSQFKVLGGPLFASDQNPEVYSTQSAYFSPRFGFAWTPAGAGGKTVVRGGAGVFVFPFGTIGINQPGFSRQTDLVATLNGYLTPAATLSNPFPNGILQPTGSSLGLETNLGQGITFYNPNPLNPYSVRWDVSVQRQLPGNMLMELAYEGNHAVHLTVDQPMNFVPAQYLSTSPFRDQALIDTLSANVKNPFAGLIPGTGLNGSTTQLQNLLKPYPEFGGITMSANSNGSSYYHALDVRLEKRYSHGLTLLANYIWSRTIERVSRLNDSDLSLEKRVSNVDRPQRFVATGTYELPFGQGKALHFGSGKWANRLLGGWVINGIFSHESGSPLGWGNLIYLGGDLDIDPRNVNGTAFDTKRFVTASNQQLSFNIRTFPSRFGDLRQDATNNLDASLLKNTRLSERLNLQLRFETFNTLNHVRFSAPNLSATSSSFGRITGQDNLARNVQLGARLVW